MGIYVNPNNTIFSKYVKAKPFVDKSCLLNVLNDCIDNMQNHVCVSRPRRFGKTMALQMAYAYYSKGCDSRAIFQNLELSKTDGWDKYLNKFNVIRLDLIAFYRQTKPIEDIISDINNSVLDELKSEFSNIDISGARDIVDAISIIYKKTEEEFVFFIDEYDYPIRTCSKSEDLRPYLNFLNGIFKNSDLANAISLAYLTGILPPIADRVESKLNNFKQFSILTPKNMAPYFGFTSSEVKQLCEQYGLSYDECCRWYDGYKLYIDKEYTDVFNPQAVAEAIRDGECNSYWPETASYLPVSEQIDRNANGIQEAIVQMITKESVPVDVSGFLNSLDKIETRDEILTYLIHLGYLSYDAQNRTGTIPNLEIQKRWKLIVSRARNYAKVNEVLAQSDQLLKDTIALKTDKVAEGLRNAHARIGTILTYNNEATLQCAIYLAYFAAIEYYTILKETPVGEGIADLIFLPYVPNKPAIVIELKVDQTTNVALKQIDDKHYTQPLDGYHGKLLKVAVNYDRKSKIHQCEIREETI